MRQSRSILIARPRAEIWMEFFAHTDRIREWVPEVVSIEPEPGPQRVGSRFRQKLREGRREMTYDGVVTAWEEGRRLESELSYKGGTMRVGFLLDDADGGTRVMQSFHAEVPGFGPRLMTPLIWLFNRHLLKKQTRALKQAAERP